MTVFRNIAVTAFAALLTLAPLLGWGEEGVPSCEVVVPAGDFPMGQPVTVEYVVRWPENSPFAVFPLEVSPPEWGTAEYVSQETTVADGQVELRQRVRYTARQAGEYDLPAVKIPLAEGTLPPVGRFDQAPGRYLDAPAARITFRDPAPGRALAAGGALAALVLAGGIALVVLRRRSRDQAEESDRAEALAARLHTARKHRLDGDHYACYRELLAVAKELATVLEQAKPLVAALSKQVHRVGYGGQRPPDDEIEGYFRDLERLVPVYRNTVHPPQENAQ